VNITSHPPNPEEEYAKGRVQGVYPGRHGFYAVVTIERTNTRLREQELITFSLNRNVWSEDQHPENGESVHLSDFTEKRKGWRARKARFWRLSDEPDPSPPSK
jgi:hypothetical protein